MRTRHLIAWLSLILCAALALPVVAAPKYWLPASGDWFDPANWDPPGVPTSADDLRIPSGSPTATSGVYISNYGSVEVTGTETLLTAPLVYVGAKGIGSFTQAGGTHDVLRVKLGSYDSLLTGQLTGTGTYLLQDGQLLVGESLDLSSGWFSQTGGTHLLDGSMDLDTVAGMSVWEGGYQLTDGFLSVTGTESIGRWAEGYCGGIPPVGLTSFIQTGGTHQVEAIETWASGRYYFEGGVLEIGSRLANCSNLVGQGEFHFRAAGPTLQCGTGIFDFSQGVYGQANGTVIVGPESLTVFPAGSDPPAFFGDFQTQGLTHRVGDVLVVPAGQGFTGNDWSCEDFVVCQGHIQGSKIKLMGGIDLSGQGEVDLGGGTLKVTSPGSTVSGGSLSAYRILVEDTGCLTQSGGSLSLGFGMKVDHGGTYVIEAGETHVVQWSGAGFEGQGTILQTGGWHDAKISLGHWSGAAGHYHLEGGSLTSHSDATVAWAGVGEFLHQGGTHEIAQTLFIGRDAGSTGTYALQGGVLSASTITAGEGSWAFNFTGGTLHAGTVEFDLLNDGGVLSPGRSIGATAILGSYTQNAGALDIELGGTGVGEFDRLSVTEEAALGGCLDLSVVGGYEPVITDRVEILSAGSVAGRFSEIHGVLIPNNLGLAVTYAPTGVPVTVAIPGDANLDWKVSIGDLSVMAGNWHDQPPVACWEDGDFNGDGRVSIADLSLLAANWNWELAGSDPVHGDVPEPATLLLLALGGLAALRRRRR